MSSTATVELLDYRTGEESQKLTFESFPREESQEDSSEPIVPRQDGGKDAWLYLAACFVIEALVWGFGYAFGVFQDYYSTHEPFKGSKNIPVIGTTAMVGFAFSTSIIISETN